LDDEEYKFGDFTKGLLTTVTARKGADDVVSVARDSVALRESSAVMGLSFISQHLDEYLNQEPAGTYEGWIAALHPENARHVKTNGLDSQFYLENSDHLVMWNRRAPPPKCVKAGNPPRPGRRSQGQPNIDSSLNV